ncbi:MAG: hypothetical protein EXR69_05440, partial [Myxococcales bacterium]|nr:hypothetical protein [Myxococcales bacterium]
MNRQPPLATGSIGSQSADRCWPLLVLLVALAWAILPLAPALSRGELPGSPFTDLYPSVWGLGWFVQHQPDFPSWCADISAPAGMPFYYSSPIHGWVGWPLVLLGTARGGTGAVWGYVGTLILARTATVAVTWGALRALSAARLPALGGALLYGASPFFHGYAVEGIIEGTDGWALSLWVWCVAIPARSGWRRLGTAGMSALALWLCVLSSWYLGMVACAGAALWGFWRRGAWWSLLGLVGAVPLLIAFASMATEAKPLLDDVRMAMGLQPVFQTPGWAQSNPFAIATWVGAAAPLIAVGWALSGRGGARAGSRWLVAAAALGLVLSTGWGPWYALPVLRSVRFPYRWHAGTLFLLAVLVARAGSGWSGRWTWLTLLPWLEGYLLSPVEPILPGSPSGVSAIYAKVRGPLLLDLPGPIALPPGVMNPSRPRARYLLYAQLFHPADSPWGLDFNSVGGAKRPGWLDGFAAWEPTLDNSGAPVDIEGARAAGVSQILVHKRELRGEAPLLLAVLAEAGCTVEEERDGLVLLALPARGPPFKP